MTLEVSELFTRELTRYIEETEELALNGLRNNRHILDMITEELMEKSRITGLEVIEKMKELSPVMFDDYVKPFLKTWKRMDRCHIMISCDINHWTYILHHCIDVNKLMGTTITVYGSLRSDSSHLLVIPEQSACRLPSWRILNLPSPDCNQATTPADGMVKYANSDTILANSSVSEDTYKTVSLSSDGIP